MDLITDNSIYDLSSSQLRFWLMSNYYNFNDMYNMSLGLFINHKLDIKKLELALMRLMNDQPILRTAIFSEEGIPKQKVLETTDILNPLTFIELNDGNSLNEDILNRIIQKELSLKKGPLWNLTVIKANDSHYLFTVMHHLICDAWSFEIFYTELSKYYLDSAYKKSNNYYLTTYLQSEKNRHVNEHSSHSAEFWRNHLNLYTTQLQLPCDIDHKKHDQYKSNCTTAVLSSDCYRKVKELSVRINVSVFTVLLSAYYLLLYRYTRQTDLVVGTMVSGRTELAQNNVIGCFSNILPIRAKLSETTVDEFIQQLQDTLLNVYEYQEIPYQTILTNFRSNEQLADFSLLQTLFVFQNSLKSKQQLFGDNEAYFDGKEYARTHTEYQLFFLMREVKESLFVNVQYACEHISQAMIDILCKSFEEIIYSIVSEPKRKISEFNLLFKHEKEIVINSNYTEKTYPNTHFIKLFANQVASQPHANALFTTRQYSYRELNNYANCIAKTLQQHAIDRNTVVGLCMKRNENLIFSLLALLKLGATYLPIDPKFDSNRMQRLVAFAKPTLILCDNETLSLFANSNLSLVDVTKINFEDKVTDIVNSAISDNDPVYFLFTSGSTGEPKPVLIFQNNLTNLLYWAKEYFTTNEMTSFFAGSSVNFDASILEIFTPLAWGGEVILTENILHYHEVSQKKVIKMLMGTPSGVAAIIQNTRLSENTESVFLSGEPLPSDLIKTLFENKQIKRIINGYGLTELTAYSVVSSITRRSVNPVTIGRPIANSEVFIVDDEKNVLPVGAIGEITITGRGLPSSQNPYYDFADERFVRKQIPLSSYDTLFTTGDFGQLLPNGEIVCLGRKDSQFKIRGYRIQKIEIEAEIRQYPGISAAALSIQKDNKLGSILVAYYSKFKNGTIEHTSLRNYLTHRLPDYMVPSYYVELPILPMNTSGKIDYKKLPLFNNNMQHQVTRSDNPYVKIVISIWREILGINNISINDSFFLLGGHSLLLPQLIYQFKTQCNIDIPIVNFFLYSTVKEFSEYLKSLSLTDEHTEIDKPNEMLIRDVSSEDDIAIIGCACRLPNVQTMDEFWEVLAEDKSLIKEVPISRWNWKEIQNEHRELRSPNNPCRWGAFIDDIDMFDPLFFNLSSREANYIDPQQRLLLETAWECIENAGYAVSQLSESRRVGVFIGASIADYSYLLSKNNHSYDVHYATGNALSILANRISYHLGLSGSSLTIDTACSSSFTALHHAIHSIKSDENELALVGSAALLLLPDNYIVWNKMGIISNDSRNATFDENASGFLPGEAVTTVLLKPLKKAIQDGDNIWGVIHGSAVNHDGASKVGINAVSLKSQQELITKCTQLANISVKDYDYIEAHGTGTPLGDSIEISAITNLLKDIASTKQITIGSVKTITGHTGPVSGLIGLLKVLCCFSKNKLSPTSYNKLNPLLANSQTYVNSTLKTWDSPERKIVGISSFGFGGSNAHIIVEDFKKQDPIQRPDSSPLLFTLSAKTTEGLLRLAEKYLEHLQNNSIDNLEFVSYTMTQGREHFEVRLAIIANDLQGLLEGLQNFLSGNKNFLSTASHHLYHSKNKVAAKSNIVGDISYRDDNNLMVFKNDPQIPQSQKLQLLQEVACLYVANELFDWRAYWKLLQTSSQLKRVILPTYAFVRKRHWCSEGPTLKTTTKQEVAGYFNKLSFTLIDDFSNESKSEASDYILLFHDQYGMANSIKNSLNSKIISVYKGDRFNASNNNLTYQITNDNLIIDKMLTSLEHNKSFTIVYCTTLHPFSNPNYEDVLNDLNLFSILLRSIDSNKIKVNSIRYITTNAYNFNSKQFSINQHAMTALIKSLKLEHPSIAWQIIDVENFQLDTNLTILSKLLTKEISHDTVCLRNNRLFQPVLERDNSFQSNKAAKIKQNSTFILTGGLGGVGSILLQWLVTKFNAKVIVLARNINKKSVDVESINTNQLQLLECDITDKLQVETVVNKLHAEQIKIEGIFHLAAALDKKPFSHKSKNDICSVISPKILGASHIIDAFRKFNPQFFILFSSLASFTGKVYAADYAVANAYLNGLAIYYQQQKLPVYSLSLCGLSDIGLEFNQLDKNIRNTLMKHEGLINSDTFLHLFELYLNNLNSINTYVVKNSFENNVNGEATYTNPISKDINTGALSILEEITLVESNDIDIEKHFIHYGIDSIIATAFIDKINSYFKVDLNAVTVFQSKNIKDFFELLSNKITSTQQKKDSNNKECSSSNRPSQNNEIAIIGISCLLPQATDEEEFWRNLINQRNCIITLNESQLNILNQNKNKNVTDSDAYHAGFLNFDLNFDPLFFKISPREAEAMSREQQLLLQLTYSALENAGCLQLGDTNTNVGVFIGAMDNLFIKHHDLNPHSLLGNTVAMHANRISHFFNFKGPSISVNTLCSSSLVAIDMAVKSLREGKIDYAIVGAVRLGIEPEYYNCAKQMKAISASGLCKSFSSEADGFVPGEGGAVVILKRKSDALRDDDPIWANILGSAVQHNGYHAGITIPDANSQSHVIDSAILDAQIKPSDISYIEAHGTGTLLGDPIEIIGLKSVFEKDTNVTACSIGSVKSNIGHLEPAAGMASLIKVLLSMRQQYLPASMHLKNINPHLQLHETPFHLLQDQLNWTATNQQLIAGISSFGIGGTDAHIIVASHEESDNNHASSLCQRISFLYSAESIEELKFLLEKHIHYLENYSKSLMQLAYTTHHKTKHYRYRLSINAKNKSELIQALKDKHNFSDTKDTMHLKLLFNFNDGVLVKGAGKQLFEHYSSFKAALKHCDEILNESLGFSIIEALYEPTCNVDLTRIYIQQPISFSLQYSFYQLLLSCNITPALITGNDVGYYVAACASGIFTLKDMLNILCYRARLISGLKDHCKNGTELTDQGQSMIQQFRIFVEKYSPRKSEISILNNLRFDSNFWLTHLDKLLSQTPQHVSDMTQDCIVINIGLEEKYLPIEKPYQCNAMIDGMSDVDNLLGVASKLTSLGKAVNNTAIYQPFNLKKVHLPGYPFLYKQILSEPMSSSVFSDKIEIAAEKNLGDETSQGDAEILNYLLKNASLALKIPIDKLDIHQPLIEMGADSLVLMSLLHGLEQKFAVKITILQLFEQIPTLAAIARHIESLEMITQD